MHVYVTEPSPEFTRIGQRERSGHNHEITHPTADTAQCSLPRLNWVMSSGCRVYIYC